MNDLAPTPVSAFAPGAARGRLRPLLAPDSIAVIGATARDGSFGQVAVRTIVASGFAGRVLPVNPKYGEVLGLACHASIARLPERPDLAVVVVANTQVEAALDEVIAAGVPAAVVFASCYLEGDAPPLLTERIRRKARAAGLAMVGANCLGFQNREHPLAVGVFPAGDLRPGNIAVISHSGSAFLSMSTLDARFRPNLIVSAGQELATTAADYVAYALDLASTRVVALFLETVRDPAGFAAALARAEAQDVPVVALKVGRTEASARLARTHSGALTGDDAAYDALFDHYGVRRVESVDELTATALLLSSPRRYVQGGLGAVLDSGGQRGMMLDLAAKIGVPVAPIAPATVAKLAQVLEYGLEPVNPVDA
ncbi:MAG: CoA-binding protein, partial [Alphaproteobacteria bacterium]